MFSVGRQRWWWSGLGILISGWLLSGCTIGGRPQISGLAVQSVSGSTIQVFLNDLHVGQTPIQKNDLKPGTYQLKLVNNELSTATYETQIHLYPNTSTSVLWDFASANEPTGVGDILELEPLTSRERAELSVVSVPEGANVRLNNQAYGLTPVIVDSVTPGNYDLTVTATGHLAKTLSVVIQPGYRLRFYSRLAKDKTSSATTPSPNPVNAAPSSTPVINAVPSSTATAAAMPAAGGQPSKPYVLIKDTGTGWLRVRSEPAAGPNNEIGKVTTGQSYAYRAALNGWYEIEYAPGRTGWISSQYGQLVK